MFFSLVWICNNYLVAELRNVYLPLTIQYRMRTAGSGRMDRASQGEL